MKPGEPNCPDCGGSLYDIKILDATDSSRSGEGTGHVELSYAAPQAAASFFTRTIQPSGTVKARLCNQCGRIFLYAAKTTPLG